MTAQFRAQKPLMALRNVRGEGKLRNAADISLAGGEFYETGKTLYNWWDRKTRYLVKITDDDVLYPYVHTWMMDQLPPEKQRSLVLTSHRYEQDDDEDTEFSLPQRGRRIEVSSNDQTARSFEIEGHRVRAWVVTPDTASVTNERIILQPDYLLFATRTRAGQDAVRRAIEQVAADFRNHRRPRVNLSNLWGQWSARPDLPLRPLESVVLKEGQTEALVADLTTFLESEQLYVSRGMPWHRGYLFYGPPGTGKTSLARGLSSHFQLDLWYLSLSGVKTDEKLITLLSQVPPRSLLLLEDIDILDASHSRQGKTDQLSLAGLLNALDGVATPHGLITIMTSNHAEILDPALVRPGRIDWQEKLDELDQTQASTMFERFYGEKPKGILDITGMTAADLFEQFKQNIDNPGAIKIKERRQRRVPAQP